MAPPEICARDHAFAIIRQVKESLVAGCDPEGAAARANKAQAVDNSLVELSLVLVEPSILTGDRLRRDGPRVLRHCLASMLG